MRTASWFSSLMLHGAFAVAFVFLCLVSFRKEIDLPDDHVAVPIEVVSSAKIAEKTNITPIAPEEPKPEDAKEAPAPEGAPQTVQEAPKADPDVVPLPTKQPKPDQKKPKTNVDLDKLAGLIDRSVKEAGAKSPQVSPNAPKGAKPREGLGAAGSDLTLSEQDAIRAAIEQNWRAPADLPDPAHLVVRVRFEINADGSLAGTPEVVSPRGAIDSSQRTAVENALRAVRLSQPLPVDKKRTQRVAFTMNFDPRLMAGVR